MKTIDIKRFGQTLIWSIANDKKQIINTFIGMFIAYVLIITISTGLFTGYSGGINISSFTVAEAICVATWIIAGGWMTAELFRNLRTKNDRAKFFLLPATNCEKYWSRVIVAIANGLVVSTVALIASDLVQMLVTYVFCGDAMSVTRQIAIAALDNNTLVAYATGVSQDGQTINILPSFVGTLWAISIYILGGTYFRKVPAVFTTLVIFAVTMALAFTCVGIVDKFFGNKNFEIEFYWSAKTTLQIVVSIIAIVFTICNMWLSYRKFSKMQVI